MRRLELEPGRALEDPVVGDERDPETERRGRDPAVGVVLALAERMTDPHAVGA